MLKLPNSKKGIVIDDLIPLIVTIIIFGLIVYILPIGQLSKSSKQMQGISKLQQEIDGTDTLINVLRSPVGSEIMSDLVVQAYLTNNYVKLEKELENYFDPMYSTTNKGSWYIEIGGEKIKGKGFGYGFQVDQIANTIIPLPDNRDLEIKLFRLSTGGGQP